LKGKTFFFIAFLWLPDFILSADVCGAIVSFANKRADPLTHVRGHVHEVFGSGGAL